MSSPIFDSTFGTGRFRREEPMTTSDQSQAIDKAALAQSDAGPSVLKTRFEEWAFTRGHRNFTKSGGGYLLPEIQKDWLAFKAGATALPPDCPTDGVAARQGNGG